VEALQKRLGGNFRLLEIDGFDELFGDLDVELAGKQRNLGFPTSLTELAFNDRPVADASLSDLNLDFLRPMNTRKSLVFASRGRRPSRHFCGSPDAPC
jgi:hypothetical protein